MKYNGNNNYILDIINTNTNIINKILKLKLNMNLFFLFFCWLILGI